MRWFAMAVFASALAAEFGVIEGAFTDTSGTPIAGVSVEVRQSAEGPAWATTKADEMGRFVFPAVPAGKWFLEGKGIGFRPGYRGPLEVVAGKPLHTGEIRLEVEYLGSLCCDCEDIPAKLRSQNAEPSSLKGTINYPRMGKGSSVVLQPISPSGAARTATATWMGDFSFSDLPPGTYSLRVSAPGHRPFVMPKLTIRPGKAAEIDGMIHMPECEAEKDCTLVRTLVRERKSLYPAICL